MNPTTGFLMLLHVLGGGLLGLPPIRSHDTASSLRIFIEEFQRVGEFVPMIGSPPIRSQSTARSPAWSTDDRFVRQGARA
jgi:hypothetical protein